MPRDGATTPAVGAERLRGVPSPLVFVLLGETLAFGVVESPSPSASVLWMAPFGVLFFGLAGARFFLGVTGSTPSLLLFVVSCSLATTVAAFLALIGVAAFLGVTGSAPSATSASPFLAVFY